MYDPNDEQEETDDLDPSQWGQADEIDSLDDLAAAVDDNRSGHGGAYPATRALPLDANDRIDSDLTCIACQYNLRGQTTTGTCPECGAPIEDSIKSNHLRTADIGWLRAVKAGFLWLIIGTVASIALAMVAGVAAIAFPPPQPTFAPSGSPMSVQQQSMPSAIITLVITVIQSVILIYAYWQITTPEPAALKPSTTSGIARWCTVVGYCISVVAALIALGGSTEIMLVSSVLEIASGLALLVAFPAFMLYFRSLALRLPSRSLAKQIMIVLWGMVGCTVAIIPLGIFIVVAVSSNPGSSIVGIIGLLICPIGLAFLTFGIWWIVLICVFHSKIGNALTRARRDHRAAHVSPEEAFGTI